MRPDPRVRFCPSFGLVVILAVCLGACDQMDSSGPADLSGRLRLAEVLGPSGADGFVVADRVRPFRFPEDHGPHEAFRSEWWYLTVMLSNELGAEFGVQFTVFRQALAPGPPDGNPWRTRQVYMAHAAVTAVREQRHFEAQRLARGHPAMAGATASPFGVWVDGWQMRGRGEGFDELQLEVSSDRFRVELDLDRVTEPAAQGDGGLSIKGAGQASYYYSVPRLTATGTVWIGEVAHEVRGSAWFDREWSTSVLAAEQVGWDWFALHLDDGAAVMAFQLRRRDGGRDRHDHGFEMNADGATRMLAVADFDLQPERYWRDERGVDWPVQWLMRVGDRRLRVRAVVPDQRMDTMLVYWEGLVGVFDEAGERLGRGYMELTGYE